MRIIKRVQKKTQAILMAFRSILTGKTELLLYLMCFFSGFLKLSEVSAPSLCSGADMCMNCATFG